MHRVRINKRRVILLRIVAYTATLTLSVLTTALLIYAAMGYRLTRSGGVVRSGLLLVDTLPVKANISIDGVSRSSAPGRFVLATGEYELELLRDGYRPWRNNVAITTSQVERVRYPILLPDELVSKQQLRFDGTSTNFSVSPDRKRLLAQIGNTAVMRLAVFNEKESRVSQLNLTNLIGSQPASIKIVAWSPNTKRAIVSYTREKNTKHLLLNLDDVSSSRVIPTNMQIDESRPLYFKGNDHFYAVNEKKQLRYFSVDLVDSDLLIDNIEAYAVTPSGSHEITFIRTSADQKLVEIGASNGTENVVLDTMPASSQSSEIATTSHDGDWYSIIGDRQGQTTKIYRNPLDKPILDSQLPFATINFKADAISISQYGRFIMMQNKNSVYSYDIETLRGSKFQLKGARPEGVSWMTDFQLTYRDKTSGMVYMLDFDGKNQQPLLADDLLVMSSDKKVIYTLSESSLGAASLLIE